MLESTSNIYSFKFKLSFWLFVLPCYTEMKIQIKETLHCLIGRSFIKWLSNYS